MNGVVYLRGIHHHKRHCSMPLNFKTLIGAIDNRLPHSFQSSVPETIDAAPPLYEADNDQTAMIFQPIEYDFKTKITFLICMTLSAILIASFVLPGMFTKLAATIGLLLTAVSTGLLLSIQTGDTSSEEPRTQSFSWAQT